MGMPEFHGAIRLGQEEHTTQDAQKGRTSHPPNPGAPRRALTQARLQRVKDRGVPSGAHGATNKEHQVCARRRVSEAAGSPLRV